MVKRNRIGVMVAMCMASSFATLAQQDVAVPQLPPEERAAHSAPAEETMMEPKVITYEESAMNPGFFSDQTTNRGMPRYLSALEISGYLRTRFSYFRNATLGTYIPEIGRGTSNFMPSLNYLADAASGSAKNPAQNNFSGNMRLRLNPTINVTELIRVRSTIDVMDNMVLGSTPSYLYLNGPTPSSPVSLMSMSQNPPMAGINSLTSSIAVKRAWGEASFPIGELRFGRMPMHWGLGILYNSGDEITSDYGDQIDGISFSTRLFDHYLTPSYSIAYTGPLARGGGFLRSAANFPSYHVASELGQRYPLESADLTHVFSLSLLKRDTEFLVNKKQIEGSAIFNYGLFASYRYQYLDSQNVSLNANDIKASDVVRRDGNVGLLSWWNALTYKTFHIEAEFAGIWGKYRIGHKNTDRLASINGGAIASRDVWLLQGGIALESKYGLLDDRLQIGLNGGIASSSDGPGFGIREGSNNEPQEGMADGSKRPAEGRLKSNFKFNPAYTVDLLMYREVLGAITGTYYLKPHISYFFSRNFGLRGDVISSFALDKNNTPGRSPYLGLEFDASSFLRTDGGFYFSLNYGVLFPFKGLDHRKSTISTHNYNLYGSAQTAQTVQLYFGLLF